MVPEAAVKLENLRVDYREGEQEGPASSNGTQALLRCILVQQVVSNPNFLDGLQNHPRFSTNDLESLAEFAVQADDVIVEYGLIGSVQWSITLKDAYTDVKDLL